MACKEDRYAIGDRIYLIRQMPPRLAVPVEVYLAKTLGPALLQAFATTGATSDGAFAVAVGILAERLDEAGLTSMLHKVFRHVGIQGQVIRVCDESNDDGIDEWFTGRNKELWQVLLQALRVNFADFFDGNPFFSTVANRLKDGILPTSPTSTSTSGVPVSQNQPLPRLQKFRGWHLLDRRSRRHA